MADTVEIQEINHISVDTKFVGDIATKHDIRIDGIFEGKLYSEANVVVGEKGVVNGIILAKSVDFFGTMKKGSVYAKDVLSLKPNCSMAGNLFFKRIQVDLDAKLVGKCELIQDADFSKISAPVKALLK